MTLTIVGASGKLGLATLHALLGHHFIPALSGHHLIPATSIVCTSSSDAGTQKLSFAKAQGVEIRRVGWDDDPETWETVLRGTEKLFLISSSRINKDFNDAPAGAGREGDHLRALEAAKKVGVRHVYYTSLAFANPSKSRVMTAHERTEEWLHAHAGPEMKVTIIREGLYNESWPLYFGHYEVGQDDRTEVVVAGDGKVSWTAIGDLGLANALVLAAPGERYAGKTFYLSQREARSLAEVAEMVSRAKGKTVKLKLVPRREHEEFYVNERQMPKGMVEWWSRTYDALPDGECEINDPTLEQLLAEKGVKPKPLEETVAEMMRRTGNQ